MKRLDPKPMEDFSMWAAFKSGGQMSDPTVLKELVDQWIQMTVQKTAGQRSNKKTDLSWDNLERVKMGILCEAVALVLCGDLDKIISMKEDKIMTGNTYQKLAMRTCSIPMDQPDDRLRHAVFGLTSEAGEVAGIMQKVYQGHEFDKEHVKKELGDCLWMIAEACEALDFDMDEVMQLNIDKLKARYPEGFSADKSLHRAEGDV